MIAYLIKDHDNALAKVKKLKKEKVDFGAAHARLSEKFETLNIAYKALESDHSTLNESRHQLQTQLDKYNIPSTSTPTCGHEGIIEENTRLKEELVKGSQPKGKGVLDEILSKQRTNNGKEGLGYVPKTKKKKNKNKKKSKSTQPKTSTTTNDKTNYVGLAGANNPNYELFCDYYGDVYASFVGPFDSYISWSIWVPKTLFTNMRGPIEKWVPKTKT